MLVHFLLVGLVAAFATPLDKRSKVSPGQLQTDTVSTRDLFIGPCTNLDQFEDFGNTVMGQTLVSDGGVIYNNFVVGPDKSLTGVQAASPPNIALPGVSLQDPDPSSIATSQICFALKEFFFGCDGKTQEGATNAPLQCRMDMVGYGANNQVVGKQSFTFSPGVENLRPPMAKAIVTTIPASKLITLTISVLGLTNIGGIDPSSALSGAGMDNITYIQYNTNSDCGFA